MNRIARRFLAAALASAITLTPSAATVYAHGHHSSGHHSGYVTNYYYCNGHEAHTHANGVCPYAAPAVTVSRKTIKKVQKRLNRCGYNCGTADGIMGSKTQRALKRYQRDNGLTADGCIRNSVLRALGL